MQSVTPRIFLIGEPRIIDDGLQAYLEHIGVPDWVSDAPSDAEKLPEVMGRLCYRSWQPGMNKNVTKVREGNKPYLKNIVTVRHGSVLEHGNFNFIFADVSRVFTHELVRHRIGTGISQESLRFVRLTDLGGWFPTCITENEEALAVMSETFEHLEGLQLRLADIFDLDNTEVDFDYKKEVTSAMRRIAPIGLATTIGWSANTRTLRHVIEMRTHRSAEEEIRLVYGQVADLMIEKYPNLFGDYQREIIKGLPEFTTPNRKV